MLVPLIDEGPSLLYSSAKSRGPDAAFDKRDTTQIPWADISESMLVERG